MKRTTSWMLIAMMSVMVLVSGCSDDSEDTSSNDIDITGTWKLTKRTVDSVVENDPLSNNEQNWDGSGGNETVTYHKYYVVTTTTMQEYADILSTSTPSAPVLGIYTCSADIATYTRNGNTFDVSGYYTFTATRSGDTITRTYTWSAMTITEIWDKVDASTVAGATNGSYCSILAEL